MSQCHDQYPELQSYKSADDVREPEGASCHDPAEISVLIAGSDDSTRSRIRQALDADERVGEVTEVAACDDAVRHCDDVDVVVVGLRSKSGLGPLGAISQIARRPKRPSIVAVSPKEEPWLYVAARAEGADQVVDWPDDELALAQTVVEAACPVPL